MVDKTHFFFAAKEAKPPCKRSGTLKIGNYGEMAFDIGERLVWEEGREVAVAGLEMRNKMK